MTPGRSLPLIAAPLLVQLPVPHYTIPRLSGNIPLAGASLVLHARATQIGHSLHPCMVPQEIQSRAGDAALLEYIRSQAPLSVGFTVTVWNCERALYLAGQIKQVSPQTTIIFGGPEIAGDTFFITDPQAPFDLAVPGEGEQVLAALCRGTVPGGLFCPGGTVTPGTPAPPLDTLATIHDPFLCALAHAESDGAMFTELYRGCAYGCSFCRYHHGRLRSRPALRPLELIPSLFDYARNNRIREIYLLDPSLEQRKDLPALLDTLCTANTTGIALSIELRADKIDRATAQKLFAAGVRTVETGLQTLTPAALRLAGRAANPHHFARGARLLQDCGIALRTDIMAGLPGDTPQGFEHTLRFVCDNMLTDGIQVFKTQVLPGTRLRAQARALGLVYQNRPPYFVVSTPDWPREHLEQALESAAEQLGIDLGADDRPVVPAALCTDMSMRRDTLNSLPYIWGYSFCLDSDTAMEAAYRERFELAACAVSLYVRSPNPLAQLPSIERIARNYLAANPCCPLSLLLSTPPLTALDLFDRINAVLATQVQSNFLEQMFPQPLPAAGGRRLFSLIESPRSTCSTDWLDALRECARVVFSFDPATASSREIERIVSLLGPDDFLLLRATEGLAPDQWSALKKSICTTYGVAPQQLLGEGLGAYWQDPST